MARHQTLRARTGLCVGEDAAKKKDGVHGYSLRPDSLCGGLLTQEYFGGLLTEEFLSRLFLAQKSPISFTNAAAAIASWRMTRQI
jgi:hypothetical protein